MTPDYRALCAELVDALDNLLALVNGECPSLLDGDRGGSGFLDIEIDDALTTARALLAEADGPAVPDGREPASVALQPRDGEIMELMPRQMHEDLAAAVRAMAEQEGIDSTRAKGVMRIMLNRHVVDLARAVLARWGRPAATPVPESGEVPRIGHILRLAEIIREVDGRHDKGAAALAEAILSHPGICSAGLAALDEAVSERLPGPSANALPTPEAND